MWLQLFGIGLLPLKRTTMFQVRHVEANPLGFFSTNMAMKIQKSIAGLAVCLVVVSDSAHSQQFTESAPGYLTMNNNKNRTDTKPSLPREAGWMMPWAGVSNCNKSADFHPVECYSKASRDLEKNNGTPCYTADNVRPGTNTIATQAFMRGAPISSVLIRANRCYLARSNSSPMPIGTHAFLTRRNVSEALLAEGIHKNNDNGEVFAAWLANRSYPAEKVRSNN